MMLTPEQIERRSQETDVELFVERLTICREAIVRRHPDPPKTPISDFIDCPICQDGQLRYTARAERARSSPNRLGLRFFQLVAMSFTAKAMLRT